MAQSLINISAEAFEMQLYRFSINQLKDLLLQIYQWKKSEGVKLNPEKIEDLNLITNIERKQTKIVKEFMRRGYLTQRDMEQYLIWENSLNKGKKL